MSDLIVIGYENPEPARQAYEQVLRLQRDFVVEPGHSAVVIMASKITEDKFAAAMQPFGGTVLKTSLSDSDEKELAEELSGQS